MFGPMRISQQNKKAIPDPRASRRESHLKNMHGGRQSDEDDGVDKGLRDGGREAESDRRKADCEREGGV